MIFAIVSEKEQTQVLQLSYVVLHFSYQNFSPFLALHLDFKNDKKFTHKSNSV